MTGSNISMVPPIYEIWGSELRVSTTADPRILSLLIDLGYSTLPRNRVIIWQPWRAARCGFLPSLRTSPPWALAQWAMELG